MPSEKPLNASRQLAAILFADVVGYTALMQKNESAATAQLRQFQGSMEEMVANYNGRIVNFYGDGALCTFKNPLEAMRCAIELQAGFQSSPVVPVRIGIHSGTVVTEGDKVYGDSVNIASRIESMGIPGAILVSKKVRDELKNKPDLLMPSLGSFEFKNVEEPMEIFALANEGFAVPKREEMKGKLKAKSSSSLQKILLPILALAIIGIGLWQWKSGERGGMPLSESGTIEPINTPLAKDIRDKRVAIMVFDNKTGSDDLEDFGVMISDWITKGLMETGDANVISAANIQDKVVLAGMDGTNTQKFAKETGVGVLVQGRYYMQENQLIIHSNVVDAERGDVIHALEPIQGPRNKMLQLLDELTDEVLGYWSVKSQSRFSKNPPKYEAYKKYRAANILWGEREHFDEIEQMLTEAISIDPDFHEATIKLAVSNGNRARNIFKRDSLLANLEKSKSQLSKWEKLRFAQVKASANLEWEKAAELCEEMYAMDESDGSSNYNAGNFYVRANMPKKAIKIIRQMDIRYRDMDSDEFSWVEPRLSDAYFLDGQYHKAIEVALSYPFPKMINHHANIHLRSLVRLDSIHLIPEAISHYKDRGVYSGSGVKREIDDLIRAVCREAYQMDKNVLLEEYNQKLLEWNANHSEFEDYHWNNGMAAYYENDLGTAIEHFEKEELNPNAPYNYLTSLSVRGNIHGKIGDIEQANKYKSLISKWEDQNQSGKGINHLMSAGSDYSLARIDVGLGNLEEALSHLKKAKNKGLWFYPGQFWQYDNYMKPLFDNPEFQEMVRPKG